MDNPQKGREILELNEKEPRLVLKIYEAWITKQKNSTGTSQIWVNEFSIFWVDHGSVNSSLGCFVAFPLVVFSALKANFY